MYPQLTIGMWVNLRTVGPGLNDFDWALSQDNGGFDRAIVLNDNRFGGIAAGVGTTYTSTLPVITVNEWHCVAVAWDQDKNEALVYYDGQTQLVTGTRLGDGGPIAKLGGVPDSTFYEVDGRLDEVFFYGTNLSAEQIMEACTLFEGPGETLEPTTQPTDIPTMIPTAFPTESFMPSPLPSAAPTESMSPTTDWRLRLIHHYKGEDNAMDEVGGAHGIILPGTTFSPGKNGQSFNLDGSNTATVDLPIDISPSTYTRMTGKSLHVGRLIVFLHVALANPPRLT